MYYFAVSLFAQVSVFICFPIGILSEWTIFSADNSRKKSSRKKTSKNYYWREMKKYGALGFMKKHDGVIPIILGILGLAILNGWLVILYPIFAFLVAGLFLLLYFGLFIVLFKARIKKSSNNWEKVKLFFFQILSFCVIVGTIIFIFTSYSRYLHIIEPTPIHLRVSADQDAKEDILNDFLTLVKENNPKKFEKQFLLNCPGNYKDALFEHNTTPLCLDIIKICLQEAILKNNIEIIKIILYRSRDDEFADPYPKGLYTELSTNGFGEYFKITPEKLGYKECSIDLNDPLNAELEGFIESLLFATHNQRKEIIEIFKDYIAIKRPKDEFHRGKGSSFTWHCLHTELQKTLIKLESLNDE
jgi:uncharacterized protein YhhL (DUF1145 family)